VEKLLDTALFAIQQIINKDIIEEDRLELQKEISIRNQQTNDTPSKLPKKQSPKPPYNNPNTYQKDPTNSQLNKDNNTLLNSIHAPIKDQSISISTEARMSTLEDNIVKIIHLIETIQHPTPTEISPTTPMQQ
jgi:hypothetical protein